MTKNSKRYPKRDRGENVGQDHSRGGQERARHDLNPEDFDYREAKAEHTYTAKRSKFVNAAQSSGKKSFNIFYVAGPLVAIVVIAGLLFFQNQSSANANVASANAVREVFIQPTVEGGKISVSAEEIRKNKLVAFDYKSGNKMIPLTAWVTPSGAIKTAVRMCEPCNSSSFRIEGNVLVCNTCGTRWDLESLKGLSGGCTNYPPDALRNTTDGEKIFIDEGPVQEWKRRA